MRALPQQPLRPARPYSGKAARLAANHLRKLVKHGLLKLSRSPIHTRNAETGQVCEAKSQRGILVVGRHADVAAGMRGELDNGRIFLQSGKQSGKQSGTQSGKRQRVTTVVHPPHKL